MLAVDFGVATNPGHASNAKRYHLLVSRVEMTQIDEACA